MSEPTTPTAAPGWYQDPEGAGLRWWDGSAWSEHRQGSYGSTEPLKAPEGAQTNTVWVWLVIVLPLLPMLPLLFIDWRGLIGSEIADPTSAYTMTFGLFFSPWYLAAIVLGWATYGLSVFFSYRDYRELEKVGVPRPFHWAFTFLSSVVYVIGRSVVVKRRTGTGGAATLWAAIGSVVLSFVVGAIMMVQVFAAVFDAVGSFGRYY